MILFKANYKVFIRGLASLLIIGTVICGTGCKHTKKVTANSNAERDARLAREKEEKMKREEEQRIKREQDEKERVRKEPYFKLDKYFNQVAAAPTPEEAYKSIDETMGMFANQEVPVLIIINKQGKTVDYDKPTTIKKYLFYLKDQKKNINAVDTIIFDGNGKIKELELIKKY